MNWNISVGSNEMIKMKTKTTKKACRNQRDNLTVFRAKRSQKQETKTLKENNESCCCQLSKTKLVKKRKERAVAATNKSSEKKNTDKI